MTTEVERNLNGGSGVAGNSNPGLEFSANGHPIMQGGHLILSMRHSGYHDPASAIGDIADNSLQADAKSFHIFIKENDIQPIQGKGKAKSLPGIAAVALSDDGTGMDLETLWSAPRFGFSTRFDDRSSMGRFGMGLANASISQGKTFSIYSKQKGKAWFKVTLNVDSIAEGNIDVPQPQPVDPPAEYIIGDGESGTVIVWEDLDVINRNYKNALQLQTHLIAELSRKFRFFIVDGRDFIVHTPSGETKIKPFDPLYLMPEAVANGATKHGDDIKIPVDKGDGTTDEVIVRFSLTPLDWQVSDGAVKATDTGENRSDSRRLNKNRGISFVRAGREIAFDPAGLKPIHPQNQWWSAEIHFPATLDHLFGIEYTKQRVVLDNDLKTTLKQRAFRPNTDALNTIINSRKPQAPEVPPVASEEAEEIARRLKSRLRLPVPASDADKPAPDRVEEAFKEIAAERKKPGITDEQNEERAKKLPLVIQYKDLGADGPFYTYLVFGETVVITLNREHLFYTKVYRPLVQSVTAEKGGPAGKTALTGFQFLIMALAQANAQAAPDFKKLYQSERIMWSLLLTTFLREMPDSGSPFLSEDDGVFSNED